MPRRQDRHLSAAEPARIALDHAVRRWEAELENDRKLSHRENGLMAFVAAVLGLGLFKLELFATPDPSGWMWAVRGLVGASLVLLFAALANILLTPERVLVLCVEARTMSREGTKDQDPEDPEAWWDELPESIREGFKAEQAMWEAIQAREAERAKPRGLLGLLGYETNTGCF